MEESSVFHEEYAVFSGFLRFSPVLPMRALFGRRERFAANNDYFNPSLSAGERYEQA